MADEADIAGQMQEQEMALLMAQRAGSRTESADEDDAGNRYCLDCGEIIPPARVQAVQAVRCVHCSNKRERFSRLSAQRGGMMRYLANTRDIE
ncbi:TraR/DksA C4-type zinc finger protein [Acidithiobacillus sp. IBUN Pt1247-S3]|uniref:TraR/DksA C4-type zinc finger protein n=1 Tax=Acidithiobacillus sp. IBUN Pt1247-S3 TaxID=3166642 RepID=UPI0034E4A856